MGDVQWSWCRSYSPPDRRPIWEWGGELELPPVLTRRGKFSCADSRHFQGPFAALQDEACREVNICAPVRSGKTLIADIACPWAVVNDNASVLRVFADDSQAKEHAELRAWPICESSASLAPMLVVQRHHKRTQEIIFSNGLPMFYIGPAAGGLQAKGWKWVVLDEPWLYKPGKIEEAKSRLGDFVRTSNSKLLCISQGGEEMTDWAVQYQSGVRHEWVVSCMSCGKKFAPIWSGTREDGSRWGAVWESEKVGNGYNVRKALETLRVECPHCRHQHADTESTRASWNSTGEFRSDGDPRASRRSFHWTALIDYPWSELLEQWLAARVAAHHGNFLPTVIFQQKRLAEFSSEMAQHEGLQSFTRLACELSDTKGKLWPGEEKRIFTVDKQADSVYWGTIRAWARGTGESRRIWFGKLFSAADIEAARVKYGVNSRLTILDCGFENKGDTGVYADCLRHNWMALRGDKAFHFAHKVKSEKGGEERVMKLYSPPNFGDPTRGAFKDRKCPFIRFASTPASDALRELIEKGLWIEPAESDREMEVEYLAQMGDEYRKRERGEDGRYFWKWESKTGNNHAWDCGKMQVAAAWILGLL